MKMFHSFPPNVCESAEIKFQYAMPFCIGSDILLPAQKHLYLYPLKNQDSMLSGEAQHLYIDQGIHKVSDVKFVTPWR